MTNDKTIETGGSAFPVEQHDLDGMTLRQYAAIKLKVPDSGTNWLDEMITASLRDDFARKAMQGLKSMPVYLAAGAISKTEATEVLIQALDAMSPLQDLIMLRQACDAIKRVLEAAPVQPVYVPLTDAQIKAASKWVYGSCNFAFARAIEKAVRGEA